MKLLAVIPARGGSKGIPRKNIRLMNGKPLISYAITTLLACKESYDIDIVVSTEDEEISNISERYGAEVLMRPKELSEDDITLDPVVYYTLCMCEKNKNCIYDYVLTIQPTSPTLQVNTLKQAIKDSLTYHYDTLLSVKNDRHLAWIKSENIFIPTYSKRLNRQQLPNYYREVGAFLISKRSCVKQNTRIGNNIEVFEVSEEEGIDIDDEKDWIVCESILKRKKIYFRADGEESLGMGHIYRCLSLADNLMGHDIIFFTNSEKRLGVERLLASNYSVIPIKTEEDFFDFIKKNTPDIVVNDILNTDKHYMKQLRLLVPRIINFEDKGEGTQYADAVINALYENKNIQSPNKNFYNGIQYFFIRNKFLEETPNNFHDEVKNIIFLFGGSDPSNLTQKCYDICCSTLYSKYPNIEFHFITGFGYPYKNEIKSYEEKHIFIHNDVKRVSTYLAKADLAVTSQGRTIYELACMGVPAIVLAQNKRETTHIFASMQNGFINLGIGTQIEMEMLENTIEWLIKTPKVRKEMREAQFDNDFRLGQKHVMDLILNER